MMATGGEPKNLQLCAVENALIDFLTPDAVGLSNVSEGGLENIISSNNPRSVLVKARSINHYVCGTTPRDEIGVGVPRAPRIGAIGRSRSEQCSSTKIAA